MESCIFLLTSIEENQLKYTAGKIILPVNLKLCAGI